MNTRLLLTASAAALLSFASPLSAQQERMPGGDSGATRPVQPQQQQPGGRDSGGTSTQEQNRSAPAERFEGQRNAPGAGEKGERPGRATEEQRKEPGATDRERERPGRATEEQRKQPSEKGEIRQGKRLDDKERTIIRERLAKVRVKRVPRAEFEIRVGAVVPRTVVLHELPPTVIEVVPDYRYYKYVLVDDSILIIDPDTLEIVDVVPA